MSQTAIIVQNLSRSFGAVKALDGVSFEVPAGSIFGYLGPNGAGKTTTIRLLLGLLTPDSGQARVLGWDTATESQHIREECGALLEHTGLYERLTAAQNLDFYCRVWHMDAKERQARTRELLEKMGLWERRGEIVKNWSHGMKKKLAVSRAMLHNPRVLFLDEPTAGLDPMASTALREDIRNLAEHYGVTIFLTTHNLSEAEKLCQRVVLIRAGKLLSIGSPDELRMQKGGDSLEVLGSGFSEGMLEALRKRKGVESADLHNHHLKVILKRGSGSTWLAPFLVKSGVKIEEMRKGKASLEEVFVELMEEENDA